MLGHVEEPMRTIIMPVDGEVQTVRLTTTEKRWFDRLLYFQRLLQQLDQVSGDVVECGVFGGESLGMLASLVRSSAQQRAVWGFDSWAGLPSPTDRDQSSDTSFAGDLDFTGVRLEDVLQTLRWYGFGDADVGRMVVLQPGFFADSLARYHGEIALAHIDADLYSSYIEALESLWPKVVVGGIVALDEYHDVEHWPGAKQAVDEFLAKLPDGSVELRQDAQYKRYFVVRLR